VWFDKIVSVDTPITRFLKERMGPRYETHTDRGSLMYDQVAVASLIDPTLVKTIEIYVDVDEKPGLNYGVSVGGIRLWPGAEGARKMEVQYDLDWERFINMYVERMAR
jgi:inosine-uridine nucleoside N-ribohydrolase